MSPHDPSPELPRSLAATARPLPEQADLGQLRRMAKDLRREVLADRPQSVAEVAALHPRGAAAAARRDSPGTGPADTGPAGTRPAATGARTFSLRDAQLVLARRYGFAGWPELIQAAGTRRVEERGMHRWFGVEFNNECWELIDSGLDAAGSADDRDALLYGAYAAARHWSEAGGTIHRARAEHLISRAELLVGTPQAALEHARRCVDLLATEPDDVQDWDAPFGQEALARALAATGDRRAGLEHRRRAVQLTAALADPQDRQILEAELARPPWFELDRT